MEKTVEVTRTLDVAELKDFAALQGPCITITVPVEKAPNVNRIEAARVKSVIRKAEHMLEEEGKDTKDVRTLIEPLYSLAVESDQWGTAGDTLVLLRSPEVFRAFQIRQALDESVTLGSHFRILPFLPALQKDKRKFYILALSQKHVRLLRCTNHRSEEVPLPNELPTSLEAWLNTRTPNTPGNVAPEGGVVPGQTGGSFTSTTDRDKKDEHLANFYRVIDKGLHDLLKTDPTPMVLVGVDYELSMYQELSSNGHLLEAGVHGSPESLKGGEMHKRALELMEEHWKHPMKKALELFEKLGGTEKVSTAQETLSKAAAEGRISHLFVSEEAVSEGTVNATALQTLAFGGEVFIAKPGQVPGQSAMAAVLRY